MSLMEQPLINETDSQSSRRFLKPAVVFFAIASIGLAVALVVVLYRHANETCTYCNDRDQDFQKPKNLETPHLFDDLTPNEMAYVKEFLLARKELNLTRNGENAINSNYIYIMEYLVPNKSDVLQHLDNNGPWPGRFARVVVFRGGDATPSLAEYKVGPLPRTINAAYDPKTAPETLRYEPVLYRRDLPFSSRYVDAIEMQLLDEHIFTPFAQKVNFILEESYQYTAGPDCGKRCIEPAFTSPQSRNGTYRHSWFYYLKKMVGGYLNPVGLNVLVEHTGTDPQTWKILQIVYNMQRFDSLDEFIGKYKKNELKKLVIPLDEDEPLWSSFEVRGGQRPENKKAHPRFFEPDGKRFTINGSHIDYLGWSFHLGMRRTAGTNIWDVRFKGDRIIYEVSLQEAAALYSGFGPVPSTTRYMDSYWNMGGSNFELYHGVDCPETAAYLDIVQFDAGRPVTLKRGMCIFEQHNGIPLRRHHQRGDHKYKFYAGVVDTALVVRSMTVVDNYDYIFDYIFHSSGALEVKVSATGYIQTSFWAPEEIGYGTRVRAYSSGSLHNHILHYKVDLDVKGPKNSFHMLSAEPTYTKLPWYDQGMWQKRINAQWVEKEHGVKYNFSLPQIYVIANNKSLNRWGEPRGYRLTVMGMTKHVVPEEEPMTNLATWARYQVAVTRHHDWEKASTSIYDQNTPVNPVVSFQDFLNDESIVDEDLVAWVSMGFMHIPHSEDIPTTDTIGNAAHLFIRPYNYYDEDPSVDLIETVIVTPQADGTNKEQRYMPAAKPCMPTFQTFPFNGTWN